MDFPAAPRPNNFSYIIYFDRINERLIHGDEDTWIGTGNIGNNSLRVALLVENIMVMDVNIL